jgi:hypothetical protein
MNEKELLLKEIKDLIAESTKGVITEKALNDKVEAINAQLKALNEREDNHKEVKDLKDAVDKIIQATADNAAAIKAMNEGPAKKASDKPVSFKEALVNAVMEAGKEAPGLVKDVKDTDGERKSLKDYFTKLGHRNSPEMVVKTEMLESSIVQNYVSTIRLTELDPSRVGVPLALYPHVTDWMPSKTITRPNMALLVVYSYSDGAATKTEGSASTISSFLLKTVSFKAFFIATYFTLSDETLDDLNEAMDEIAVTAPSKILDKIDGYILGTAGDDSSAIGGLFSGSVTKHTDFAGATTYLNTIAAANEFDVISTMKLQAETSNYMPDVVIMNPTDVNKLAAKKDQVDNSITDRRVVFNVIGEPVAVCGLRIIKSTAITADTLAVVDSKQLMIGKKKDMTMEIGYNAADFTEGQKTVVLKVRLAFGVRDPLAVIYCDGLAAAVANITV